MDDSKALFSFSKFTSARGGISSEICRQFGYALSKRFTSPVLGSDLSQSLNFRYLTYEKWWNATVSGPRIPS